MARKKDEGVFILRRPLSSICAQHLLINLTFSGVVEGVNSVTVMMGRDMEWMGGGGTGGTTVT